MPFEATRAALQDIVHNVRLAQSFVAGVSLADFEADTKTRYAAIRCLEIISEASRRGPDEIKLRHATIPWRQIAGAGNVYRHDYQSVGDDLVLRTIQESLPTLAAVVEAELRLMEGQATDGP